MQKHKMDREKVNQLSLDCWVCESMVIQVEITKYRFVVCLLCCV